MQPSRRLPFHNIIYYDIMNEWMDVRCVIIIVILIITFVYGRWVCWCIELLGVLYNLITCINWIVMALFPTPPAPTTTILWLFWSCLLDMLTSLIPQQRNTPLVKSPAFPSTPKSSPHHTTNFVITPRNWTKLEINSQRLQTVANLRQSVAQKNWGTGLGKCYEMLVPV